MIAFMDVHSQIGILSLMTMVKHLFENKAQSVVKEVRQVRRQVVICDKRGKWMLQCPNLPTIGYAWSILMRDSQGHE